MTTIVLGSIHTVVVVVVAVDVIVSAVFMARAGT
jgi:hypothetical protein